MESTDSRANTLNSQQRYECISYAEFYQNRAISVGSYGQKLRTSVSTEGHSQRQFLQSSKVFSNILLQASLQNCPTRKKKYIK
jgi:hypothetical protein